MASLYTKANLKKEYRLRFLFRFLFTLVSFVFPAIIIGIRFDIINNFNGIKLSIMG